jgi:hypothetical protein
MAQPNVPPVDAGRAPRPRGAWSFLRAEFNERFDGATVFIGQLLAGAAGLLGGREQVTLAFGLAIFAAGLGMAIAQMGGSGVTTATYDTAGHLLGTAVAQTGGRGWGWMAIGGFLVGLVLPAPRKPRR